MSETIPWWLAEAAPEPLPRRPLDRPPDVEVIGGGITARAYWLLTEQYLDRLELLAGDALTRPGSLRLAADEEEFEQLRLEYAALREDGFAAEWRDRESLTSRRSSSSSPPTARGVACSRSSTR